MKGDRLTRKARYGIMAALITGTFSIMPMVQALPVEENPGAASITKTGSVMGISSNAANNLITWQSFSIGKNEQVNFDNHNYLNYVTGNMRSDILGSLTGGGNVYLVNPNGIVIGDDAQINVGSLHLSTAELSEAVLNNFDSAVSVLNGAVTPKGDVINKGNLHAAAITVQGENITFKNVAEVDATEVTLNAVANGTVTPIKASGEIHLGYKDADGDYSTVAEPSLDGWTLNGDVSKYMLVETPADLQAMNTNLSGNYMLANDIDMSVVDNFMPIGVSNSNYFTGRFDGGNHIISNLTIEYNEYGKVGFFGGVSGILENFGLDNSLVKTTYSVNDTGGVAGVLQETGVIRNVYDIGDVIGSNAGSTVPTGGIVGRLAGGTVSNVFHRGSVSGIIAGGIVGYFTGNNPIVENAYNEGSVTGTNVAGGVVGDLFNSGQVNNVYNAGSITSTNGTNAGGVLGEKFPYGAPNPATVFHEAYYATTDSEGNNINQGAGTNSYGSAKTLEELTNTDSYSDSWSMDTDGSDSHSTWRIYPGQTTPFLTAFMTPLELSGTTSYELSSVYTGKDILVGQGANGNITVRNVGEYTINDLSSLYSNQQGYNIHVADGTTASLKYTVTPAALTVTAAAAEKVYDGTKIVAAVDGSYSVNGLLGSDTYSNPVIAFDNKNVGTGKAITISGGNLVDGNNGKNYAVTYIGSSGTITPKELSLAGSVINATKIYDGTTAVNVQAKLSLTGMVSGDDVSLNTANIEVEYPDKNVGNYALNYNSSGAVSLVGADASNYTITGVLNNVAGTGSILPKELAVSFADVSKVYDGTTAASPGSGQLTGVIGEDNVSLAAGISAEFDSKHVGSRSVNYSGIALAGTDAGNYVLANQAIGKGKITAAEVTFKANDFTKEYDGTVNASGASYSVFAGQLFADDQAGAGTFAYAGKEAGKGKVLNLSNVEIQDGNGGQNYHVSYLPSNNSSILSKKLTVSFADVSKVYDGTTAASPGSGQLTGVIGEDNVSLAAGISAEFDSKHVGSRSVNYSGIALAGTDAGNYVLANQAIGKGKITAAEVTFKANDFTKEYDGTVNASGASYSVFAGQLFADDQAGAGTFAYAGKEAGKGKVLNLSNVEIQDGNGGQNYHVSYLPSNNSSILSKKLTVSFADVSKVYDGTTAASPGSGQLTGVIGEDNVSLAAGISAEFDSKHVGSRSVNYSGIALAGTDAGNYVLANQAIGKGKITTAEVTFKANDFTKEYDGTVNASGASYSVFAGQLFADDQAGAGTFAYAGKEAGKGKVLNLSNVEIQDGNGGQNYHVSYLPSNNSSILSKKLTVSFADVSKVYDGTTAASPGSGQLTGVIGEDNVSLAAGISAEFDSKHVGSRSVNYSGIALAGTDAGNYVLANQAIGRGKITAAEVTFKANDFTKEYDGTVNASGASYSVFAGQLFADDQAGKGNFVFADSAVGTGKILNLNKVEILDGNGGKNYHVTYLPSNNSVIKAQSLPVIPLPPITPVPPKPKDLPVPQPPKVPSVIPVPKVVPVPPSISDWRENMPLMREAMAYQGASLYSNGGGSGKEGKGRFKGIKMEEGLGYYTNNSQLSFLSKGIKAPSAMSFYDILAMWSFTK